MPYGCSKQINCAIDYSLHSETVKDTYILMYSTLYKELRNNIV